MGKLNDPNGEDQWEFSAEIRYETPDAYLVFDGEKEHWLPKSKTEVHHDRGNVYSFIIPMWLAETKEII